MPYALYQAARELAAAAADAGFTCKVLEKDDCVKLKMGSYLAVSQVHMCLALGIRHKGIMHKA
jgi:leucyl aminopeptidase